MRVNYAICTAYLIILLSSLAVSPSTSFTMFAVFTVIYFMVGTILAVARTLTAATVKANIKQFTINNFVANAFDVA